MGPIGKKHHPTSRKCFELAENVKGHGRICKNSNHARLLAKVEQNQHKIDSYTEKGFVQRNEKPKLNKTISKHT